MSQPEDHSAAGRIKSTITPNDPIGKRNRYLQTSSAVPQPNVPPRTSVFISKVK